MSIGQAAEVDEASRFTRFVKSSSRLGTATKYLMAGKMRSAFGTEQLEKLQKELAKYETHSYTADIRTPFADKNLVVFLSSISQDYPKFVQDAEDTVEASGCISYLQHGRYAVLKIVSTARTDEGGGEAGGGTPIKEHISCSIGNMRDFQTLDAQELLSKFRFPIDGSPFNLSYLLTDKHHFRIVSDDNALLFCLARQSTVPDPNPAQAVHGGGIPGLDVIELAKSAAMPEGKRAECDAFKNQQGLREEELFAHITDANGAAMLVWRAAQNNSLMSNLDLYAAKSVALHKLSSSESFKAPSGIKCTTLKQLHQALYPTNTIPDSSSDVDLLLAVVPFLQSIWRVDFGSLLLEFAYGVRSLAMTNSLSTTETNKVFGHFINKFQVAIDMARPTTTPRMIVESCSWSEYEARLVMQQLINSRKSTSNSSFGERGGGRGGGGGRDQDAGPGKINLSKYCIDALRGDHKKCPFGDRCNREHGNVPFKSINKDVLAKHISNVSGRINKKRDGEKNAKKAKKAKKSEAEDGEGDESS